MNFQQLRSLRELTRRNFSLTAVAHASNISQPGVSSQVRDIEQELGFALFDRDGKRLTGLTAPGVAVMRIIERLLDESEKLQRAGSEYIAQTHGELKIAATHTQARYAMPSVVQEMRASYPDLRVTLQQGTPQHIAQWLLDGRADIGIASEGLLRFPELVTLRCYQWQHVIVVPEGHPLLALARVELADLAACQLIVYDQGFAGRGNLDQAFTRAGLKMDIIMTAMDSDVIKEYVALGLGVGIIASMAYDVVADHELRMIPAGYLFDNNSTVLALRPGVHLRAYMLEFILRFAPGLSRDDIELALRHRAPQQLEDS